MQIQIKSIMGRLLFEGDFSCLSDAVSVAVKKHTDLSSANLRSADLSSANLRSADFSSANLRSADFSSANLSSANLSSANLSYVNLRYADLRSADGAAIAVAKTRILPEGDIVGWKKCQSGTLVKLLIPKKAKRSHAFGRKCRAEFVKVLEVVGAKEAKSIHDGTVYVAGKTVKPKCQFDENWMAECASGIHFFITREEAEEYN